MKKSAMLLIVFFLLLTNLHAELYTSSFVQGVSNYSGGSDTFLRNAAPDTNYGTVNTIQLRSTSTSVLNSGYLKFTGITLMDGHKVVNARLKLYANSVYNGGGTVEVWDMLRDVDASLATWNTYDGSNSWETSGGLGQGDRGSASLASETVTSTGFFTIEIPASLVQDWIDNPSDNYGVLLAAIGGCGVDILSNDYSSTYGRPELIIESRYTLEPAESTFIQGYLNYSGGSDTFLRSAAPTTNYSTSNVLQLRSSGTTIYNTGVIKFADISIPEDHKIVDASLRVYLNATYTGGAIELWDIKKDVNAALATWNSYDGTNLWSISGGLDEADRGAAAIGANTVTGNGYLTIDIDPDVVQDWLDNPSTNYGMQIVATGGCGVDITSNEITWGASYKPSLILDSVYVQDDFTLGWYSSAWGPGYPDDYSTQEEYIEAIVDYIGFFRSKGLNTIMPYHVGLFNNDPEAWLEAGERTNVKILIDVAAREMIDQNDYNLLYSLVNTYKNHPALGGWYIIDEPLAAYTQSQVAYVYNLLKTLDTAHPAYVVHCTNPQSWVNAGAYCDVLMYDHYPIYDKNYYTDVPWTVAVKAREMVTIANQTGWIDSSIFVVQDFGEPISNGYDVWDYPTEVQLRYMSYAPIVEGVKGIMWYKYEKYDMADSRYGIVPSLSSEISSLVPAVLSGSSAITVTSNYDTDTTGHGVEDVTYLFGEDDDGAYLISVNNTDSTLSVTFDMTGQVLTNQYGSSAAPVEVLFEDDRSITSWQQYIGGVLTWCFSDSFGPYDVNVYRLFPAESQ